MNKTDKILSTHGFDTPEYDEKNSVQGILFVPTQFGEHSFIFHLLLGSALSSVMSTT